ncbi:Carbonic anhydrase 7-like protein [Leptotrombidium deliense]|uniref:carbonic anhydrase n=1 Tax=Leptotrombidium deliense TaxID=299467 RepID=A0A443S4W6_9ACAR|nr:Carbonic anhydrase 7-like protein [Leptotrombidium deliense]
MVLKFLFFVTFCVSILNNFSKSVETAIFRGQQIHDVNWSYETHGMLLGVKDWAKKFKQCGGNRQSPINIVFKNVVKEQKLGFSFSGYYSPLSRAFIENTGHTSKRKKLNNIKQIKSFILVSVASGSNLHIVHFNAKYKNIETAIDKPDGLVVLGILYQMSKDKNKFLKPLLKLVKRVPKFQDKMNVADQKVILRDMLPRRLKPFFVYSGSLTTPPCYETEAIFRKQRSGHKDQVTGKYQLIGNNYRPVLAVNGRYVAVSGNY